MADYVIPSSGAQHIKNPRWPPHASIPAQLFIGFVPVAILSAAARLAVLKKAS